MKLFVWENIHGAVVIAFAEDLAEAIGELTLNCFQNAYEKRQMNVDKEMGPLTPFGEQKLEKEALMEADVFNHALRTGIHRVYEKTAVFVLDYYDFA